MNSPGSVNAPRASTFFVAATALAALLALVPFWLATHGTALGMSPDSTQYLATARSVVAGRGLLTIWWAGRPEPLTQFPPLYPLAIALVSMLRVDPARAAWVLHAVLVPTNVLLVAWCASRVAGGTARERGVVAVIAALAAASTTIFVTAHAMLWSEPSFTALLLLALAALSRSVERQAGGSGRPAARQLLLAALLAGFATVTRYAGVALVGTACLALLELTDGSFASRLRRALLFAVVAMVPLIAWALYNRVRGAAPTDRAIALHPMALADFVPMVGTVSRWFVPYMPWRAPRMLALACVMVALVVLAAAVVRKGSAQITVVPDEIGVRQPSVALAKICALFIVCYTAFLIFVISVADRSVEFDDRLLFPALPPLIALVAGVSAWVHRTATPVTRLAVVGLAAACIVSQSAGTAAQVATIRRHGGDLDAVVRATPTLIDHTRALPANARIYSNMPEAIYYTTGRIVRGVPRRFSSTSQRVNANFAPELSALADTGEAPTYVVFFDAGADQPGVATPRDVDSTSSIQSIDSVGGGRIMVVRPRERHALP